MKKISKSLIIYSETAERRREKEKEKEKEKKEK
jgi:hypothetical protein